MPLIAIVILAIIVVGALTAVTVPVIVGDPVQPVPEPAKTEIRAPAEPGVGEVLEINATEDTYVDPYAVYPEYEKDEEAGFYDEEGNSFVDEEPSREVPEATRASRGATGRLDF